jgi:hypothetical protein
MAISIDWLTHTIHIPQSDLTWVSGTLYELDTNQFRLDLKALEASVYGMPNLKTHNHNTTVTIVGVTYARAINILVPYSIEFEDGAYSVMLTGSNNNIFDIGNGRLIQNQVQVIPTNSAGLIQVTSGSGMSTEEHDKLMGLGNAGEYDARLLALQGDVDTIIASIQDVDLAIAIIRKLTGNKVTKSGDIITIFEDNGVTTWRQYNLALGGRVQV